MTSPLSLLTTKGSAHGEPLAVGLLLGLHADPRPLRPPAAQAEVEDRLVGAEEAERQRVVGVDEGTPRVGARPPSQEEEGRQRRPTCAPQENSCLAVM